MATQNTTLETPEMQGSRDTAQDAAHQAIAAIADLYGDEAATELAKVADQMVVAYGNTPDKQEKALAAVIAGRVHVIRKNLYEIESGTTPGLYYTVEPGRSCSCKAAMKKGEPYACSHLVAAEMARRVRLALGREWLPALEPLAGEAPAPQPPAAQDGPGGTHAAQTPAVDFGQVEGVLLDAPRGHKEGSPFPLPLRSISAIVADLSRPLPAKCWGSMQQGGSTIAFLHWQHVTRLLDTYAPGWHGAVIRLDQVEKVVKLKAPAQGEKRVKVWVVTYRLTIPCLEGEVSREAMGCEDEDMTGYGDITSNAEAMALKRAAAKFGVGASGYDNTDGTAEALAAHLRDERIAALEMLGLMLDSQGRNRDHMLIALMRQTGSLKRNELPLWAIRSLTTALATALVE